MVPLLCIVALFVVASVLFARSVILTRSELSASAVSATALQNAIAVGNKDAATRSLASLQTSAAAAHHNSSGPLWQIFAKIPFVGDDIGSVSTVSAVLDDVASSVMPPLVKLSTRLNLNTFAPHNGKVDLKALATLSQPVAEANSKLSLDNAAVEKINVDNINGLLKGPIGNFKKKIGDAAGATKVANDVLSLVPTMLGGRNRVYLLAFQNNSEARSTGGIAGSYLLADVNNGSIKLSHQGSTGELGTRSLNFKLTAEEQELYPDQMVTFFQDTNLTPEFPRTAEIMRAMAKKKLGIAVDGVISVDPVAMSYVLNGTGPVKVPDGTVITSQNAASELLNNVYKRYPNTADSDKFFTDTAAKLFTTVTGGVGNAGQTVRELVRASQERRVLVWSAHSDEQQRLGSMSVSATLQDDAPLQPTLGVYLNDTLAAKMDYYLRYKTSVRSMKCEGFGSQTLQAVVGFRSSVPRNPTSLPPYILGASPKSILGQITANVDIYLPTGAQLLNAHLDSIDLGNQVRMHNGHPVATVPIAIVPGGTQKITLEFRTQPGQSRTIQVNATPGVEPGQNVDIQPSLCG